jgi:hypothetical protein
VAELTSVVIELDNGWLCAGTMFGEIDFCLSGIAS